MIRAVRDSLFSTLFPQLCYCCRGELTSPSLGNACAGCWEKTVIFQSSEFLCVKCGRPEATRRQTRCWQCDGHEYDIARSIGVYSFALRAAVVGLKTQPHIPQQLGRLLFEAFGKSEFEDCDLLVPIPLSKQRRLERGFNQAEVMARLLAKATELPVDSQSLIRTKHSNIHRAGMDEKARDLSVRDSFAVARPKLIEGRTVLLVDDVLTTGSTASYCAKALKKSGAKQVKVLTIARAI